MYKKFTLLLTLFFFVFSINAQTLKEFSPDPGIFLEQLEEYVTKNKMEEIAVQFKQFKTNYQGGAFNEEQKTTIFEICNDMLKQKMSPASFFLPYMKTCNVIALKDSGGGKLDEFNTTIKSVMGDIEKRNFNDFKAYMKFADVFYTHKALRKSTASEWRMEATKYDVNYGDKKLEVKFLQGDLVGVRKKDSIRIEETTGSYFPFEDKWVGEKGQVSWERLGLENVFVKLGKYEFETKKNAYICKDATLHYQKYFPGKPIQGVFEDRIIVSSSSGKSTFPRFESNDKVLRIDNIGADVAYVGGFRLSGTTVYGYGNKQSPARLEVKNSKTGKIAMRTYSEQFLIKEDIRRIVSEGTETSLYFGKDSIYHPSSNIRFEIDEKTLTIERGDRGSDRNPFFDSYHQINLDTDRLDWALETDSIVIGQKTIGFGGGDDKKAVFESMQYFSEAEYRELQNISTVNPIATIMGYSKQQGSDVLDAEGLAQKLNPRFDVSTITPLLYSMVAKGFIEYDPDEKKVYLKEKLKHYARSAVKKSDYDEIYIVSKTKDSNAVLYLDDENENPVDINAVRYVELSPVQKVAFKPMGNRVMMKRNRNMEFNGKVFAGMSIFTGKDFGFDYNGFQIALDSIRYMELFENTGEEDENGDPVAYGIGSRIEDLSGTLLIDAPNNKSGKEDIAMFPSFTSSGYAYVYYDAKEIRNGVYDRDSFYFRLNKFGFNNLDKYLPSDIKFKGKMFPSDIFPPFDETLVLMGEDKSLGFLHQTPSGGYDTYVRATPGGKGNYDGQISLTNNGFEGKGDIKYLVADISSEDIVFYPKLLTASARRFDIEEVRGRNPEFPQVRGLDVDIRWVPYADSMYVKPDEHPFAMYQSGLHTLDGTLILTPGGLRGNGTLDWDKAYMFSRDFLFGANSLTADTTNISIKGATADDDLVFQATNIKGDVDFDKGIGKFKANSEEITTAMPANKYKTSMNEFTWDMNEETVEFKSESGKLDEFLSPELDSLRFQGATATYDIKSTTLKIGGVPYIKSADALVYPETGDVEIEKGGIMKTLENARIIASHTSKLHAINRATVNIKGGRDYTAKGYYEYNVGDRKQEILFSEIIGAPIGKGKRVEKKLATRGSGTVDASEEFYIDHKTQFQGDISLSSEKRELDFDGFARFDADLPQKNWFTVKSEAEKNNLVIAYNEPKSMDGEPLRTGVFIDQGTGNPYPAAMGILYSRKDRVMLEAVGAFKYNKRDDEFIFGDSLKLTSGHYKGNEYVINLRTRECTAKGTFGIGEGVPYIKPTVVGQAVIPLNTRQDSTGAVANRQPLKMDGLAMINYILPEKAMKIMEADLTRNLFDAPDINYQVKFKNMVPDVVGGLVKNESAYKQVTGNFKTTGKVTLPNTSKSLFFFSFLPLKWDPNLQSMVSSQKRIGLGQVNGKSINKMVEGYVEFRMPSNGVTSKKDGMHLLIQNPVEGGHYYYFKYKNGILQTVSSNPAYNAAITGLKAKELTFKMGKDEVYTVEIVSEVSADLFRSRIKSAW